VLEVIEAHVPTAIRGEAQVRVLASTQCWHPGLLAMPLRLGSRLRMIRPTRELDATVKALAGTNYRLVLLTIRCLPKWTQGSGRERWSTGVNGLGRYDLSSFRLT
jgi:hypothetical protein